MYFGSVKFYKHLIYIVLTLFVSSSILGIAFGVKKIYNCVSKPQKNCVVNAEADEHTINHYPENHEFDYQKQYPNLYAQSQRSVSEVKKGVCYLTFDDGPSKLTNEVLDILDKNNIKATFFVVVNDNTDFDIIKKAIEKGHSIGIHSHTHKYDQIYVDVDSFLQDMNIANDLIYENTNYRASIIRFPGGSINSYNAGFYEELISEMLRRNYHYFDWNVSFEDAGKNISADSIIKNVEKGLSIYPAESSRIIVLAHDAQGKYSSIDALQCVIDAIKAQGFTFDVLDNTVPIMSFNY